MPARPNRGMHPARLSLRGFYCWFFTPLGFPKDCLGQNASKMAQRHIATGCLLASLSPAPEAPAAWSLCACQLCSAKGRAEGAAAGRAPSAPLPPRQVRPWIAKALRLAKYLFFIIINFFSPIVNCLVVRQAPFFSALNAAVPRKGFAVVNVGADGKGSHETLLAAYSALGHIHNI